MLPAVVELFAQAGALIGKKYASAMREYVVIPRLDEEKWVVWNLINCVAYDVWRALSG